MLNKCLMTKFAMTTFLGLITPIGAAVALPLPSGCGEISYPPTSEYTLNVDGNTIGGDLEREYEVFVPAGYDSGTLYPLVFLYHEMGLGTPVNGNWLQTNWIGPIVPLVVSPRALSLDENDLENTPRAWNLNPDRADVEFIDALKREMIANYCIDEDQIFAFGGSSGGFGALGTGCHNHMSALVSDRGGILHLDENPWGFPVTPVPTDEACGPIPALIGNGIDDPTVTFDDYAVPTEAFFIANNGCDAASVEEDEEATAEICETESEDPVPNCLCERYSACTEELIVCSWEGHGHSSVIGQDDAMWFFNQVGANTNAPQCRDESFDGGGSNYQWDIRRRLNFNTHFHAGKERLHVDVPRHSWLLLEDGYIPGAYARFDETVWDVPLLKDFSVSLTLTNLKYKFPEVRLRVFAADAIVGFADPLAPVPMLEIRTSFDAGGNLTAQAYNDGLPAGTAWPITRSGPGGTRLWDGACWMMRGDPISDEVIVYSRNIDSIDWPNCSGDWVEQARFINPYFTSMAYDYNTTPAEVRIEIGRNDSLTTATKDGYVRIDDVYIGRRDCGAGEWPL